jgi:hypothetical protein
MSELRHRDMLFEAGQSLMTDLDYDARSARNQAESRGRHRRNFGEILSRIRPLPRISVHAFVRNRRPGQRPWSGVRRGSPHGQGQSPHQFRRRISCGKHVRLVADTQPADPGNQRRRADPCSRNSASSPRYCDPDTRVVIVGHVNDVTLYRELIRNGISEYIVAPVSIADLMNVVSTLFVDPEAEPLGRSIAFVGAKGGVGSSTIAHNVSWAFRPCSSPRSFIADMDLPFGTANLNFDQDPAQGIAEAVFSSDRIDEVYLDRLLAKCAEHLSLLAAPSMLDKVLRFRSGRLPAADRCHPAQCALCRARRSACLERLDPRTCERLTRSSSPPTGTGQSAQHQEPDRHAAQAAPERFHAAPDPQPGRHAETAGNRAGRFCRSARASSRWRSFPSTRNCSATAANSGRMLAESDAAKSDRRQPLEYRACGHRARPKKKPKAGLSSLRACSKLKKK